MGQHCMREIELETTVSAKSETKEEAVAKAFQSLRDETAKRTDGVIVYMRPTEVTLEELKTDTYIERFLFFFFPRQKQMVSITFRIKTLIHYLVLEGG